MKIIGISRGGATGLQGGQKPPPASPLKCNPGVNAGIINVGKDR